MEKSVRVLFFGREMIRIHIRLFHDSACRSRDPFARKVSGMIFLDQRAF